MIDWFTHCSCIQEIIQTHQGISQAWKFTKSLEQAVTLITEQVESRPFHHLQISLPRLALLQKMIRCLPSTERSTFWVSHLCVTLRQSRTVQGFCLLPKQEICHLLLGIVDTLIQQQDTISSLRFWCLEEGPTVVRAITLSNGTTDPANVRVSCLRWACGRMLKRS